jgi:EpsI family protein
MPDSRIKYLRILSIALLAQAAVFYGTSRGEKVPDVRPLQAFSRQVDGWSVAQEGYVDDETQAILRADDTLTRTYVKPARTLPAYLFVAFFKTQKNGKAPHSPKNCMPGTGWEPTRDDFLKVNIPGLSEPIEVNRYVIAKGNEKSVVLYWYQSRNRVIASEYKAKMWTVADAVRYNRTDTALVRVIVPVAGNDEAGAEQIAIEFVQSVFLPLRQYLPS